MKNIIFFSLPRTIFFNNLKSFSPCIITVRKFKRSPDGRQKQHVIFPRHFWFSQALHWCFGNSVETCTKNIFFLLRSVALPENNEHPSWHELARAIFEIFFSAKIKKLGGCFLYSNFTLLAVKLKVLVSSGSLGTLSKVLSSNALLAPLLSKSCGGILSSEEGSSGWNA